MKSNPDFKIFKANRISFGDMYSDVLNYIKNVYNNVRQEFTIASPFGQVIQVVLNLGRMILFYIENSITELNINTARHARSVRGLAALTGHNPSSGIAARGSLYMSYNMTTDYLGETISIKNYTKIKNLSNGLTYITILPTPVMRLTVGESDSKIELPIIQGELKYQQATGSGEPMQSYSFADKSGETIDNFFMNIYINGVKWNIVDSFIDMGYNQKCCIIKPSFNGGVDVFFGNGINGAVPKTGETILFEYLNTSGIYGNVQQNENSLSWEFEDSGYSSSGDYINLNEIYNLSSASDILFGTMSETLSMTKILAPNVSRNFVLANANNYKYFLSKLNMFSIIDAFSGFNTIEDVNIEEKYVTAKEKYKELKESYIKQINLTGENSKQVSDLKILLDKAKTDFEFIKIKYDETFTDDNVIYLYLVPDISKRINPGENYFTCSNERFILSEDEKLGLMNLIEDSGQKIITVDNIIIDPKIVRFSINIFVQIWSNFNFDSVKSNIISSVSEYFISNTRRDRIPTSDLIKIVEDVPGVDSVSLYFDADKQNSIYYGIDNYGIDEYGDIILKRNVTDVMGNVKEINDLLPLFRGNFTSFNNIEYSDDLNSLNSVININLRGKTNQK